MSRSGRQEAMLHLRCFCVTAGRKRAIRSWCDLVGAVCVFCVGFCVMVLVRLFFLCVFRVDTNTALVSRVYYLTCSLSGMFEYLAAVALSCTFCVFWIVELWCLCLLVVANGRGIC